MCFQEQPIEVVYLFSSLARNGALEIAESNSAQKLGGNQSPSKRGFFSRLALLALRADEFLTQDQSTQVMPSIQLRKIIDNYQGFFGNALNNANANSVLNASPGPSNRVQFPDPFIKFCRKRLHSPAPINPLSQNLSYTCAKHLEKISKQMLNRR